MKRKDWRELRHERGLSIAETARRAGINKGRLSAIETRWSVPTPEEAKALLAVLEEQT